MRYVLVLLMLWPLTSLAGDRDEPWLRISVEEQTVLRDYYRPGKAKRLPPGLAKKAARGEALPPGWQRKLARGEVMPVEVYRQSERLPRDVVVQLPPAPDGTVLVRVEGKIVRLIEATRTIVDVLEL